MPPSVQAESVQVADDVEQSGGVVTGTDQQEPMEEIQDGSDHRPIWTRRISKGVLSCDLV